MGRGFLEIFANNPSIFPLENEEISYSFFTEKGNYVSTKKLFEVDFFERNKRVFFKALLSGAWVCKNSLGEALAKKKKENIGMWVSKQWWIFFKRQRQQQACFAHRTQEWERDRAYTAVGKKYTGWTAIAPWLLLLCSSSLLLEELKQIFINAKCFFWLCNFIQSGH